MYQTLLWDVPFRYVVVFSETKNALFCVFTIVNSTCPLNRNYYRLLILSLIPKCIVLCIRDCEQCLSLE